MMRLDQWEINLYEKGGYARGWGSGVTYKARRDREEKRTIKSRVYPARCHRQRECTDLIHSRKLLNLWELRKRLDQSERILQSRFPSKENGSAIKCRLWHLKKTTIIVEGTVYKSDGKIMLHNKALPKDCYKVSIDKSLVDAAFIPDVGSNGCTTVLDAVGGFVAWPKNQVVFDPKKVLATEWITLAVRLVLIDTGDSCYRARTGLRRFEIQNLVEQAVAQSKSLKDIWEIPRMIGTSLIASSPPTCPQSS
ncbi:hypothetical protein Tco_0656037 [Tanacetum coccineum]|uniref:DUF8039 domain-containing protein n=1 Tax=Tanacetum coccineum TaxID=301880 RepID=A0ABQ4X899_9ASTR